MFPPRLVRVLLPVVFLAGIVPLWGSHGPLAPSTAWAADCPNIGLPGGGDGVGHSGNDGVCRDRGDAPFPFPTRLLQNGARHIRSVVGPILGDTEDFEPDGQPSPLATLDGNPDEDGVLIDTLYIGGGAGLNTITISTSGGPGIINAWIDFGQDGSWSQPGDAIITDLAVPPSPVQVVVAIPIGTPLGMTFARFRISSVAGLTPTGEAPDGEVEDYAVKICEAPEPPMCCTNVMMVLDASGSMMGAPYAQVQTAAIRFASLYRTTPSTIGAITFTVNTSLLSPLTTNSAAVIAAVKASVSGPYATDLAAGITAASLQFPNPPQQGCSNVMLIFTDGQPTSPDPATGVTNANTAAAAAKASARLIVLGINASQADWPFLSGLASSPGDFINAPTPADLQKLALELLWRICGGTPPIVCPPSGDNGGSGTSADLGDAPDSTNHFGLSMTAYTPPTIPANFPSVFDVTTGNVQGPKHLQPRALMWLGPWVTEEFDADLLPDQDFIENIDPPTDRPDRDWADDGFIFPLSLPACDFTTVSYLVTGAAGSGGVAFANAWFDYNRDGDWADLLQCYSPTHGNLVVPEWSVQDQPVNLAPGTVTVQSPMFVSLTSVPDRDLWARLSLADSPAPMDVMAGRADGRGPGNGYQYGETEDYLLWYAVESGGYSGGGE